MVAIDIIGRELHGFDYNDKAAVNKQFRRNISEVEKLKNHTNSFCWIVGIELNLSPGNGQTVNPKVYDSLKDIVLENTLITGHQNWIR
jgi:hypothetical protein